MDPFWIGFTICAGLATAIVIGILTIRSYLMHLPDEDE